MCSIIGYIANNQQVSDSLVNGLKRMEYRGYDSVGLATVLDDCIHFKKGIGKVSDVDSKLNLKSLQGSCGIGHTRWATNGRVSDTNAHPHVSNSAKIAVVHNGIIENYTQLRSDLENKGFTFHSETDTEIIPNLLQYYLEQNHDIKESILNTVSRLEGQYSFVALFGDSKMAGVKNHEPLILGVDKDGYFVSSDILGFIEKTNKIIYIEDEQFVMLDGKGYKIYDFEGDQVHHTITETKLKADQAEKGMFPHFTLKEIYEQPNTIPKTNSSGHSIADIANIIQDSSDVFITGSGTSYHAALVAKYLFARYTGIKSHAVMSSEFEYFENNLAKDSTVLAISQSGESADVLNSVELAKKKGAKVVSIVNVVNSSLARESSCFVSLDCGPEIGVAATKSFTSQLALIYQLVQKVSDDTINFELDSISEAIHQVLYDTETSQQVQDAVKALSRARNIYVIGKGLNYPIAKEGALKLKELTYIPTEGIAAGELKHGPLALMDESACVIALNPHDSSYKNTVSNINEIRARGATVIGITDHMHPYDDNDTASLYDHTISIPKMPDFLYPFAGVIPFQLLAYYMALERGIDPDYPRNLAKSVTVK